MKITFILMALSALFAIVLTCAWQAIPKRVSRVLKQAVVQLMFAIDFAFQLPNRFRRGVYAANINPAVQGQYNESLTRKSDAAITARHLLVKIGSDDEHIAVSGASDRPIGTCIDEPTAAEEDVTVHLLGRGLTQRMVAVDAIAAGAPVYAAASGKVSASGTVLVGVALTTTDADNDPIAVNTFALSDTPGISASAYNANTILYATTDNTPVALTIGASTIVGRKATGNIIALTGEETHVIASGGLSSIVAATVAAAGTTVADAGQLGTASVVRITSDGATKGVKLPTGVAGMVIDVINTSSTAAELYAASGGTVNGLAADASVVVPASKGVRCFCTAADTWTAFDMTALAAAS